MPDREATAAAAALARAQILDSAVRDRSRWFARYQLVFGFMAAAAVLGSSLIDGPGAAITFGVLWAAAVSALGLYGARQPVNRRGLTRRHHTMIALWGLLHAAVITPGTIWFRGDPAWWVSGAVVVALPWLIGAWLDGRR
ncbi:hypothetical protein [Streptomyces sp. NPDC008001]|uniref:hypothetical protein n=1 Tax=Streptomyces sp. NPDC008001 TaxID=3364804 RepID=UPI0036F12181